LVHTVEVNGGQNCFVTNQIFSVMLNRSKNVIQVWNDVKKMTKSHFCCFCILSKK